MFFTPSVVSNSSVRRARYSRCPVRCKESSGAAGSSRARIGRQLAVALIVAGFAALGPAVGVVACSPQPPQLTLQPDEVAPGQTIALVGTGFAADVDLVTVRLNGRAGPVLWSGHPDSSGRITVSFAVPPLAEGFDFVNAYADGSAGVAEPVHASLRILRPAIATAAAPTPPAPAAVTPTGRATEPANRSVATAASWALIGVAALLVIGVATATVFAHRRRGSARPHVVRPSPAPARDANPDAAAPDEAEGVTELASTADRRLELTILTVNVVAARRPDAYAENPSRRRAAPLP